MEGRARRGGGVGKGSFLGIGISGVREGEGRGKY